MNDAELLHRFACNADQAAFAELVQRHLNFVYAASLRHMNGDTHQAEDVAQQVFTDLARKARQLLKHPCLVGWLYACTRLIALQLIRTQQRRAHRESQATLMTETIREPRWENIRPVIDEALADLNERERRSVLLRFFANQDFKAVREQLGLTDNAAQKLVKRALDHLNAALSRRGITSTSAALTVALGSSAATAPASLASLIIAAAPSAAGITATTSSFMILVKIAACLATAGLGFGGGVWYKSQSKPPPAPAPLSQVPAERPDLQQQLLQATKRAELAEEDNTRLLDAIQRFKAGSPSPNVPAGPAPSTLTPSTYGTEYIVRPGDTAATIAQLNGVPIQQLQLVNQDIDWARLKVGQRVRLQ